MNILVTGGAGYIGSHTVGALAAAEGLTPVVFDNLSTGHAESVPEGVTLVKGDIHDIDFVAKTLETYKIDGVIHFAAYSLVGESMVDPAKYYTNNVEGTLHLLLGMQKAGVSKIVFSSTAAVYGEPEKTPIEEDFSHNPTNVYGRTKLVIEHARFYECLRSLLCGSALLQCCRCCAGRHDRGGSQSGVSPDPSHSENRTGGARPHRNLRHGLPDARRNLHS